MEINEITMVANARVGAFITPCAAWYAISGRNDQHLEKDSPGYCVMCGLVCDFGA